MTRTDKSVLSRRGNHPTSGEEFETPNQDSGIVVDPWPKWRLAFSVIRTQKNWPTYFADYLGLRRSPFVQYRLRNGVQIRLRPGTSDRLIYNDIWLRNVYGKCEDLCEGDVVIDIGAHIGAFSILAGSHGAQVYSFEPFPRNFSHLQENVVLNGLGHRISSFNLAVWDRTGEERL